MKYKFSLSELASIIAAVLTVSVSIIAVSTEFRNIASQMLKSDLFFSILASVLGAVAALLSALFFYRIHRSRSSLRIFISHRHEDEVLAKDLSTNLKKRGYIIFDPDVMIKAGDKITEKTKEIIKSSDLVILIMSGPEAISQWTGKELDWAMKYKRAIIPLSTGPSPELPEILEDVKFLVLRDGNVDETMPMLLQAIEAHPR